MGLTPLKAVKRGAQSTPGSARPKLPPPLSREEGELLHDEGGQEMRGKTPVPSAKEVGTPRPQEAEETVLALGAILPSGDAYLGGLAWPEQTEEGRAIVALSAALLGGPHGKGPARPKWEEKATPHGARAPWSGPTLTTQREGPDLFWMTRRRLTSSRVWTHASVPVSRPSTERLSS